MEPSGLKSQGSIIFSTLISGGALLLNSVSFFLATYVAGTAYLTCAQDIDVIKWPVSYNDEGIEHAHHALAADRQFYMDFWHFSCLLGVSCSVLVASQVFTKRLQRLTLKRPQPMSAKAMLLLNTMISGSTLYAIFVCLIVAAYVTLTAHVACQQDAEVINELSNYVGDAIKDARYYLTINTSIYSISSYLLKLFCVLFLVLLPTTIGLFAAEWRTALRTK